MQIHSKKLTEIKPYWRNPRKNDTTVEALKKSISDFGFNQPLVVDSEMVLVAGHARYRALKQLGWDEAPCIITNLDEKQAKAYRIADNKTAELSVWDNDSLILELRELVDTGMETYFPEVDLKGWIDESVGVTVAPITNEQFSKVQGDMSAKYSDTPTETTDTGAIAVSASKASTQVEMMCPHCSEIFFVERRDLK